MPAWIELDDRVRVRQSARYAMNSVLLPDREHTVLVDPGILPSELDDIAAQVALERPESVTLVFTHGHWDHVLGRPWWPDAETLAHDRLAAQLARDGEHARAEAERIAAAAGERWPSPYQPFAPTHAVSGLHFRKLGRWRLVLRDAPGHCASQLTVHLPEPRILIAADTLSDIEIPALETAPAIYRHAIEPLVPIAEGGAIETLIPGHGSIAHGRDAVLGRILADLEYLDTIERAARDALRSGEPDEAAVEQLRSMDYRGKHSAEYPMVEIHAENIRHAYRAIAAMRNARAKPAAPSR